MLNQPSKSCRANTCKTVTDAKQGLTARVIMDGYRLKRPTRMWLTEEERESAAQAEHTVECTCQQCRDAILLEDDPSAGQWITQAYAAPGATADVMAWLGSDDDAELDAAPPPSRPDTVAGRVPTAGGRHRPTLSRPTSTNQRSTVPARAFGKSETRPGAGLQAPPKPMPPPSVATNPLAARRPVSTLEAVKSCEETNDACSVHM